MKLFLLEIDNGWEYADYEEKHKLIVVEDIAAASIKAVEFMNENYSTNKYATPSFHVTSVTEVEGYRIEVKRVKEKNNEKNN